MFRDIVDHVREWLFCRSKQKFEKNGMCEELAGPSSQKKIRRRDHEIEDDWFVCLILTIISATETSQIDHQREDTFQLTATDPGFG